MPTNRDKTHTAQDSEMTPAMPRTRTRSRAPEPDMRGQRPAIAGEPQTGQAPPAAWEEFLDALNPFLDEVGDSVRVLDRAGWVKIENPLTGHKLYFNKGITGVTRVESSLPVESVKGAAQPEFYNGRISSILPAEVQVVGEAIRQIAKSPDRLSPPRRRTRDLG